MLGRIVLLRAANAILPGAERPFVQMSQEATSPDEEERRHRRESPLLPSPPSVRPAFAVDVEGAIFHLKYFSLPPLP